MNLKPSTPLLVLSKKRHWNVFFQGGSIILNFFLFQHFQFSEGAEASSCWQGASHMWCRSPQQDYRWVWRPLIKYCIKTGLHLVFNPDYKTFMPLSGLDWTLKSEKTILIENAAILVRCPSGYWLGTKRSSSRHTKLWRLCYYFAFDSTFCE